MNAKKQSYTIKVDGYQCTDEMTLDGAIANAKFACRHYNRKIATICDENGKAVATIKMQYVFSIDHLDDTSETTTKQD